MEEERKKENSTERQKPNVEAEVYNNYKNVTEGKKKLKSLIRFHSANKINNYNRGGKKERKKSKRIYRSKHKNNVFLVSLLSVSFPLLGITVHFPSLGCPPALC